MSPRSAALQRAASLPVGNQERRELLMKLAGKALTVGKLIQELSKMDRGLPVYLFAEGEEFPALQVQQVEGDSEGIAEPFVEIGGGWAKA